MNERSERCHQVPLTSSVLPWNSEENPAREPYDAEKSAERQNVKRARITSRIAPGIDVGAMGAAVGISVGL